VFGKAHRSLRDRLGASVLFIGSICIGLLFAGASALRAQVVLSEILYDPVGVDTGQQSIEIRNLGQEPAPIGGFWLSFKPTAWQVPAGFVLPREGTVVIHVNQSGVNTPTDLYTGTAGIRSLRREDAVSLFLQNLFSDATKLVGFVEWGAPHQSGEEVAAEAGQWNLGDPIPVSALREGSSIAYRGSGRTATAWCVDGSPSLGLPNDECTVSRARSAARINEVLPGPGGRVEILNASRVLEDLDGKFLLTRTSSYRFPPGTILLPGQLLVVHLGQGGVDGPDDVYTGPGFSALAAADSVSLYAGSIGSDATLIIDFLEWQTPGQPFEPQAAEAGVWAAGRAIDTGDLVAGGSLSALPSGSGLDRWQIDNTPTLGGANDLPPEAVVVLNEILVSPAGGEPQSVELLNVTTSAVDVSGWNLCSGSDGDPASVVCASIPGGTSIPARSLLVVDLKPGPPATGHIALSPFPALGPAGDELALLRTSRATSPNNFLDYLRWGAGAAVLEVYAAAAGIWTPGEAVSTEGIALGTSIAYLGSGRGPGSYRLDTSPSFGQPNAEKPPAADFVRSDCNQDASLDLSDPITAFDFLFFAGESPPCRDACDANDDGSLDISDPVYTLGTLFLGGAPQKPPVTCGPDSGSDDITCESFVGC